MKSPSFFTPSSACFTTSVATRFTRATGDCFRVDFFRVDLRVLFRAPADLRVLFERLADLLRPRFFDAVAPRRDLLADDLRAPALRFRAEPRDFLAPDDRFFEAFRPDFLLDDFLRVAIGQLLMRRVCTARRKIHAHPVTASVTTALRACVAPARRSRSFTTIVAAAIAQMQSQ